ncbi:MAG: phosphoenolpyruvate kinase [Acidobacteriota bacterium]
MPMHTVYLGAERFARTTPRDLADGAAAFFDAAFPTPDAVARLGLDGPLSEKIHARVKACLEAGPVVQDLRLDFEDSYAGEDALVDANRSAELALELFGAGELPDGFGLRLPAMAESTAEHAFEILDHFARPLVDGLGRWPEGFVVALAKISSPREVHRLAAGLDQREVEWGLGPDTFQVELMAETPRSIYDSKGRLAVPTLLDAAPGRVVGVHFGVYDYTASLGVVGALQGPRHPACDVARSALQIGLAGSGVELSDGSSRRLPEIGDADLEDAATTVYADIRASLERGIYRGWDLSAPQIALRWLAVTAFFLEHVALANAETRALEDTSTRTALETLHHQGLESGVLTVEDLAS